MEETTLLPIKRVELSLSKFNDVAIPHHLELLRQHKANINKYEEAGDYRRVLCEQTNAARVAARLRALLAELEALRRRVRPPDWPRFDALTQRARDLTLRAVVDYLDAAPAAAAASLRSTDSVGLAPEGEQGEQREQHEQHEEAPLLHLQVDEHELALQQRELVLRGWAALQHEVRALHDAWQHVQAAALQHRDQVGATAASVAVAADNAQAARAHLSAAERLRSGAWLAGGALCGALAGGPVGLAVGAKAGAAAALAGSLLGCLGARLLGRRAPAPAPASKDD